MMSILLVAGSRIGGGDDHAKAHHHASGPCSGVLSDRDGLRLRGYINGRHIDHGQYSRATGVNHQDPMDDRESIYIRDPLDD
jgi:hypothetical protein